MISDWRSGSPVAPIIQQQHQQGKLRQQVMEMSRLMLNRDELTQIKVELKQELLQELRQSLSFELTGATGRLWKKIEKKLSEKQGQHE